MSKFLKLGAMAAIAVASVTSAWADSAETKGGLTVKTDDGRFEMKVGGRIQLDTYQYDEDTPAEGATVDGTFFRRTYLTLTGKLYGWKYKYENDFAAGASPVSIREMWIATDLLGGELILGQHKPFRGMEELTSSNEILFMERPFATSSGIYSNIVCPAPAAGTALCGTAAGASTVSASRQFSTGAFYKYPYSMGLIGVSTYNIHQAGTFQNDSQGVNARVTFTPIVGEGSNLHLGLSASVDDASAGSALRSSVSYAGRSSSTQVTGRSANIVTGGVGEKQQTLALEAAAAFGPFFAQSEYAQATFEDAIGGTDDADVQTYYVQTSWFITGESKPYKADRGAFGTPKPNGTAGAWEVKARYDFIENKEVTDAEITATSLGVNWYVNPNVRFMLDYVMGDANDVLASGTGDDKTKSIAARAQLSF